MSKYQVPRIACTISIVLGWTMALSVAVLMALALLRILPASLFVLSLIQLTPFLILGLLIAMTGHVASAVFDIADRVTKREA